MNIVSANGLSLHFVQLDPEPANGHDPSGREPASAATIVLIHGLAVDNLAGWYLTLAGAFAAAGLRVVMYDLRGHGRSERPPTGYRLADHVDDLEALLAALEIADPVYLGGNSFGGTIAFSYALRHPGHVAGIAAIESLPLTAQWVSHLTSIGESSDAIASALLGTAWRTRTRQAYDQILAETTLLQDTLADQPVPEAALAALTMPALCIYGGKSRLAPFAAYVERIIPGARAVVIPGCGHALLIEAPRAIKPLILSWLSRDCRVRVRSLLESSLGDQ
jgi:pimeloyl-ACP methyl ester carboxylesterase